VDVRKIVGVTLLAKFAPTFTTSKPFDIGLDFLNLNATGAVEFTGQLQFLLGLGITKEHGIYLMTDFSGIPLADFGIASVDSQGRPHEISLTGAVTFPEQLDVVLGSIHFTAGVDGPGNELAAGFFVDLRIRITTAGWGSAGAGRDELQSGVAGRSPRGRSSTHR
jgi:hypothetical protein